jgi:hypothetical protein
MEIGHYLIYRSGLTPLKPSLSRETISIISTVIKESLDQYGAHGSIYQLAKIAEKELNLIAALSEERLIPLKKNIGSKIKNVQGELRQKRKDMQIDGISNKSLNLYSGC